MIFGHEFPARIIWFALDAQAVASEDLDSHLKIQTETSVQHEVRSPDSLTIVNAVANDA